MLRKILSLAVFVFTLQLGMSLRASEPIKYEWEFTKGKLNFVIEIAEGFKYANGGTMKSETMMSEYIPENDVITNWSEIMTIMLSKGIKNPMTVVNLTVNSFKYSDPKCQSLVTQSSECNVPVIYAMIDHSGGIPGKKNDTTHEILGIKTVCNCEYLCIIQYAIRYDSQNTNENEKEAIRQKIKTQLQKNTFKKI